MKKIRRIFSFALALVFCFTAMSTIVLASYEDCNHSSIYHSYVPKGGIYEHYVYCELCGRNIESKVCDQLYYDFDCTAYSYCIWCERTMPSNPGHRSSGTWYVINSTYHGNECSFTFQSGGKCTGTTVLPHEYGIDSNVCNDCGYVMQ